MKEIDFGDTKAKLLPWFVTHHVLQECIQTTLMKLVLLVILESILLLVQKVFVMLVKWEDSTHI
jgi:hypothetical protein